MLFLILILSIGALTTFSDLKSKKIHNWHLGLGALLGLAAIIYTAVWTHENVLFHFINGLIAFVAGTYFYRSGVWRGGDAKLFMLYAFLMPALERDHILFSGTVNLFACSFIAGMIILIPLFIKDIISNYNAVIKKLLSQEKSKDLFRAIGITIFSSWIIFPVYSFVRINHIPAISLAFTYLIFNLALHFIKKIKINYIIGVSGSIFGFLMRLWLSPHSLSWPTLSYSIFKIGLFSALSAGIYASLDLLKEYHDRVPFAPLLFIGCVLSYTPFLTWIMLLICR